MINCFQNARCNNKDSSVDMFKICTSNTTLWKRPLKFVIPSVIFHRLKTIEVTCGTQAIYMYVYVCTHTRTKAIYTYIYVYIDTQCTHPYFTKLEGWKFRQQDSLITLPSLWNANLRTWSTLLRNFLLQSSELWNRSSFLNIRNTVSWIQEIFLRSK